MERREVEVKREQSREGGKEEKRRGGAGGSRALKWGWGGYLQATIRVRS